MRRVTFSGGVHPEYNKNLASQAAITDAALPDQVVLPCSQHLGAPARPVVAKGDLVKVGQVVAESGGFVSVPIHATVSGKVVEVAGRLHPTGVIQPAVVIAADGKDEWVELDPIDQPLEADPDVLKERVRAAGVVGLGGATFPSHVKLSPPKNKPIDRVLLNGAECEPYLTADDRLMREEPERVVKGFRIVMRILGVSQGRLCIEDNKPEAMAAMQKAAAGIDGVEVVALATKYPQGGEKQLIQAVLGRQVPSGGLPMDCGVVVFNVGTCAAIHDAVYLGRPLVDRVCTVTGRAVAQPSNMRVRLGTPVASLLEQAGGTTKQAGKVILGGPMMGLTVPSLDVPVIKGTSGVLVQAADEVVEEPYRACIRCGMCVRVCPIGLTPNEMGSRAEMGHWEELDGLDVMDCIECGSCAYVCPAYRPLVQFFKLGKAQVRVLRQKRKEAEAEVLRAAKA
ncbi:MAG: electron transport complex subunit RsxC [Deltaproteobacteria bacterium]|nr:electron transport complex subunit RsxC [Deltaproteobacteria bacterium]